MNNRQEYSCRAQMGKTLVKLREQAYQEEEEEEEERRRKKKKG
jgi:hypothetical protein